MDETAEIRLQFTYLPEDSPAEHTRTLQRPTPVQRLRTALAWMLAGGAVITLLVVFRGSAGAKELPARTWPQIGHEVLFCIGLLAAVWGLMLWLRNRAARTPATPQPHDPPQIWCVVLRPQSIAWGKELESVERKWARYERFVETAQGFILYAERDHGDLLPKRVMTAAQIDLARQWMAAGIKGRAQGFEVVPKQ